MSENKRAAEDELSEGEAKRRNTISQKEAGTIRAEIRRLESTLKSTQQECDRGLRELDAELKADLAKRLETIGKEETEKRKARISELRKRVRERSAPFTEQIAELKEKVGPAPRRPAPKKKEKAECERESE